MKNHLLKVLETTEVIISPNLGDHDKIYTMYIESNTKELIIISEDPEGK